MMDNSPILLHLKTNEQEYRFFQFVVSLNSILLFGVNYDPDTFSEEFLRKFNFKLYNELQSKFQFDESHSSAVEISLVQTVTLLGMIDGIAKALLANDAETFKSMVRAKFPEIDSKWDMIFFKSAQNIFEMYKQRFERFPKLIALIDKITEENKF
jgi:hypothetical protein